MTEKDWQEFIKKEDERISSLSPKDVSDYIGAVKDCLSYINNSIMHSLVYVCNPVLMDNVEESELKVSYGFYRDCSVKYLENDVKFMKRLPPIKPLLSEIKVEEGMIERIEKRHPKEELGYANGVIKNLTYMMAVTARWSLHLGSDKMSNHLANFLGKEGFKELYEFIVPFTKDMMDFDLKQAGMYEKAAAKLGDAIGRHEWVDAPIENASPVDKNKDDALGVMFV